MLSGKSFVKSKKKYNRKREIGLLLRLIISWF